MILNLGQVHAKSFAKNSILLLPFGCCFLFFLIITGHQSYVIIFNDCKTNMVHFYYMYTINISMHTFCGNIGFVRRFYRLATILEDACRLIRTRKLYGGYRDSRRVLDSLAIRFLLMPLTNKSVFFCHSISFEFEAITIAGSIQLFVQCNTLKPTKRAHS